MQGLLSVRDACERLDVHKATLYRSMARGELQFVTVGKRRRFTEEQLERYLYRRQADAEVRSSNGGGYLAGPVGRLGTR